MLRKEPRQYVLELPHRPALGAEDFLVSRSNAAAVALVDRWPEWALSSVLITGPRSAGKTHLGHVWRLKSGAAVVTGSAVTESSLAALRAAGALVVEDIDRGIADERIVFHLLNLAREHGFSVLITSARAPGELDVSLPDLRSRLRALPVVSIEMPDDDLLKAVLVKLFSDRQLVVEPHVIDHIAVRMERSMAAAGQIVAQIDRRAMAMRSKVTRILAAEALAAVGGKDTADC